jgi:hypothetical protein
MTGTNWRRENKRAKIPRESITSVGTHTRKTQHRSARSLTFPPFFGPILVPFSLRVAALFLSISSYSERVFFLRCVIPGQPYFIDLLAHAAHVHAKSLQCLICMRVVLGQTSREVIENRGDKLVCSAGAVTHLLATILSRIQQCPVRGPLARHAVQCHVQERDHRRSIQLQAQRPTRYQVRSPIAVTWYLYDAKQQHGGGRGAWFGPQPWCAQAPAGRGQGVAYRATAGRARASGASHLT